MSTGSVLCVGPALSWQLAAVAADRLCQQHLEASAVAWTPSFGAAQCPVVETGTCIGNGHIFASSEVWVGTVEGNIQREQCHLLGAASPWPPWYAGRLERLERLQAAVRMSCQVVPNVRQTCTESNVCMCVHGASLCLMYNYWTGLLCA